MDGVKEMERLYASWPTQILRGYKAGLEAGGVDQGRSIVFCGMGGSGVTGDIVGAVAEGYGARVNVCKSQKPPAWLGPEDLVVGVSYSGNTLETLRCVRESLKRGASVAVITSGGKLARLAQDQGLPLARVSEGFYPRTAMAEMVGAGLGLLSRAYGISGDIVEEASRRLEDLPVDMARNIAERLANAWIVGVVACGPMGIAARRIRSELAENSKVLAREEVYPESGHNDIVSWQASQEARPGFIMLYWPMDGWCTKLLSGLEPLYGELGPLAVVKIDSPSILSAIMEASLVGGLASIYLAGLRGLDPRDTSLISRYKESLARLEGSDG
ncbi:MAG: SIS domain-containing protein [Desulfurococcales archaeon]|nr:SIS domain-containing protein [Desulfurococcales archaeon]